MLKDAGLIPVAQATIRSAENEEVRLEYLLHNITGPEGGAYYGLRVDKYLPNGELIESADSLPFTGSLKRAATLAEVFAAGTVTPCVLQEMVTEWQEDIIVV